MKINLNESDDQKTQTRTAGEWREQQYLTREEVAEVLRVSTRTVSELTAKGVLVAVKLGGGRNAPVRYRRDTLDETTRRLERR